METSKFSGLAGKKLSFAKLGAKSSDETRPEIIATTMPNKFQLNRLASRMLGLETGNRVKIVIDDDATDINEMYYLVVANEKDGDAAKLASVGKEKGIGRVLVFNFSGVWSRMIQMKVDASELSAKALSELGFTTARQTVQNEGSTAEPKLVYSSKTKVFGEIIDTTVDMEIEGAVYHMYAVTNLRSEEVEEADIVDDID